VIVPDSEEEESAEEKGSADTRKSPRISADLKKKKERTKELLHGLHEHKSGIGLVIHQS
jgi:hypothetical protein